MANVTQLKLYASHFKARIGEEGSHLSQPWSCILDVSAGHYRKEFAEKLEVIAEPERKRRLTVGIAMGVSDVCCDQQKRQIVLYKAMLGLTASDIIMH